MPDFNSRTRAIGRCCREYLRRCALYDATGVNRVEIDMLRSRPDQAPAHTVTTWRAGVWHPMRRGLSIRERLPSDADVELDLQAAFLRAVDDGPYDQIDYTRPPDPPLSDADAAWAAELLAGRP